MQREIYNSYVLIILVFPKRKTRQKADNPTQNFLLLSIGKFLFRLQINAVSTPYMLSLPRAEGLFAPLCLARTSFFGYIRPSLSHNHPAQKRIVGYQTASYRLFVTSTPSVCAAKSVCPIRRRSRSRPSVATVRDADSPLRRRHTRRDHASRLNARCAPWGRRCGKVHRGAAALADN